MKKHSLLGKFFFWIGFFMFVFGIMTRFGSLDYNFFVPNKSTALIPIFTGIALLLISNIFKATNPKSTKIG